MLITTISIILKYKKYILICVYLFVIIPVSVIVYVHVLFIFKNTHIHKHTLNNQIKKTTHEKLNSPSIPKLLPTLSLPFRTWLFGKVVCTCYLYFFTLLFTPRLMNLKCFLVFRNTWLSLCQCILKWSRLNYAYVNILN